MKTDFFSIAIHQLRTSLTTILWFTEVILSGAAGPITDKTRDSLGFVRKGAGQMASLLKLLLQITRVESARLRIEPVPTDLRVITQEVVDSLQPLLGGTSQRVSIIVHPTELPRIPMDRDVVWNIIINLLSNAIRYSPAESAIVITMEQRGDMLEYSVQDHGIGIAKEQQKRVFEPFFRADKAVHDIPEGSGLGLTLAKMLVDQWGGKIWFTSEEGAGTTMTFTIPLAGMPSKGGEVKLGI